MELTKVYLKVNQNGETENVFATIGKAIDDLDLEAKRIEIGKAIDDLDLDAKRIEESHIVSKTLTTLEWRGRNGKDYSYEIKECPICNDIRLDYMDCPRILSL